MRNPTDVLNSLTEKSKDTTYKFQRLYRNLYNPSFYWLAYQNIYANKGSMTPGVDGATLSGLSENRIGEIIASLKDHSYQPLPARREYIEKKNSNKKRPLGISSADDKLVQEIVRMILETIFEPTFSDRSHGFRPERSCHTALLQIQGSFTGVNWFVEGDIEACFDSFDHHTLIELLRRRIDDDLDMFGFYIEVTGISEDGAVKGNVFEVGDYAEFAKHIRDVAEPLDAVTLIYSDDWGVNAGKAVTISRNEYDNDRHRLICENGNVTKRIYHPRDKERMTAVISNEHSKRMAFPIGSTSELLQRVTHKLAEVRNPLEPPGQSTPKPQLTLAEKMQAANEKVKAQDTPSGINKSSKKEER